MRTLAATLAIAIGLAALATAAQAADSRAAIKVKVLGWSGIYKNTAHTVSTPNNGVLTKCEEPGSMSVVVAVSNITKGLPYAITWAVNGKTLSTKKGTMGAFDAVPDLVYSGFRRKTLANGVYKWKLAVSGVVRASAKVTRSCA